MSLSALFIRVRAKVLLKNTEDKILQGSYVINGLCVGVHRLYNAVIQIFCHPLVQDTFTVSTNRGQLKTMI